MRFHGIALAFALAASGGAQAMTDAELAAVVDRRLQGDRTGACFAAAVVDGDRVARAYRCADPAQSDRIGPDSAFEIGSVSKTMLATLLADLIVRGELSLDDPLAGHLPEGTAVPDHRGQPILLRHIVTHSSGLPPLPPRMEISDPDDPYATLDADTLLASLGDVTLDQPPGSRFEYSNFASMVLSWVVAQRAGQDFETLARERLFAPAGMAHAYIRARPEGARAAAGHLPVGKAVPAWTFPVDLAGVGGVRATLDDMVRYAQAQLGAAEGPLAEAIALAQRPVDGAPGQRMAMHWMLAPLDDREVLVHEGGTGGFSSYVAVDPEGGRAVVVLSDTAVHSLGGLGGIGHHLLDARLPLGEARRAATPSDALLDGLAGDYRVGDATMHVRRRGGVLAVQVPGQPEAEMGYDSAGDFYPLDHDALLSPRQRADGTYAFVWRQGGGAFSAVRVDGDARAAPDAETLRGYGGTYALAPGFDLVVREREGTLHAQATGQGEFALEAAGEDAFEALAYGIEIRFRRDAAGAVEALELHQGGQVTHGARAAGNDPDASPAAPCAAPGQVADAAPDAAPAGDYDGVYPLAAGFEVTVRERGGALEAQGTGQPAVPLQRTGEDAYAAPQIGLEIDFRRGDGGRVEALELRQNGQVLHGRRR